MYPDFIKLMLTIFIPENCVLILKKPILTERILTKLFLWYVQRVC